jgi:RNA polymerase sigma-70 factor (ECF subfamily)
MPVTNLMDETTAIKRLQQNDLAGLETLVALYQVRAVYVAYLIVQDRDLAEDVAQNAFLRAAERISTFDAERPFGPWFIRIVANLALDAARREKKQLSLEKVEDGRAGAVLRWLAGDGPYPQDLLETAELLQAVREAIAQLPPQERAVIVLRYFAGMSEKDMTRALRRPPSTIKWRLHEAKRHLKDLLRPFATNEADRFSRD